MKECFLFSCRLLTTNLTKNDISPWMFLFHFAIEKYCPSFQITQSVLNMGCRIDFIEVESILQ